jgi:hypothetical protein
MIALALRSLALPLAALACSAAAPVPQGESSPTSGGAAAISGSAALRCAPEGSAAFCWINPLPQGSSLVGLWAAGPDDAWAVGPLGAALHWDGHALTPVPVPTAAPLRAVWGSAADDVWAAGDAVLHYDGRTWSAAAGAPVGSWNAVRGAGRGEVWLVGAGGAAARFDGTRWWSVATPGADDLAAVAVVSPAEVYVATALGGTVLRFDGAAFSTSAQLAARALWSLFAPGPGELWAAGEPRDVNASAGARGTALAHLVAGAWSDVTVAGLETASFFALHGAAGELWVAGASGAGAGRVAHLDASGWHAETLPALPLRAVQASGGAALASGDGGQLFVRGASGWSAVHRGPPGYLQSAAFSPQGDGWFSAALPDPTSASPQAQLLHLSGGAVEAVPVGVADVLYGVWASASDDVWAGSLANGFLPYDGKSWRPRVGGYAGLVDGVWASGPSDVWGVAGDAVVHFDGSTVTRQPLPGAGARRIFGLSPRELWVVGAANAAYHYDGASWSSLPIPGLALAAWGRAADDVWLVGEGGLALHWDGHAFARIETGTTATLWAVGGTASEVWAAGAQGTALRYDGRAFAPVATGTLNALGAVAVSPAGDVYLAGDFGTILLKAR